MKITSEDLLLLSALKINNKELEKVKELILKITNWDNFISNIIERGIAPVFFQKLKSSKNSSYIPNEQKVKLRQSYYKTLTRSAILYQHFINIIELFNEEEIPVIALKGIYLSEWLYQDIGLRQMSDIDILVHQEDGIKCIKILKDIGYSPAYTGETEFVKAQTEIVHYPPMSKDGVFVEVHIKLHKDAEKYHLDTETLWQNAIPVTLNGVEVFALGKYDQLIHLCVHLHKHFKTGHVQFTCLMDIVNYLEKYANDFNWDELTEACKEYNCVEEVFKYIVLCNKYMHATVPVAVIEKYKCLLTTKDEERFFDYLNGRIGVNEQHGQNVPHHVQNIKKLKKIPDKAHYLLDILFPSKDFMFQKYLNQWIIDNEKLIVLGGAKRHSRAKDKEQRAKNKDLKQLTINNEQLIMKEKRKSKLSIINYQLLIKFWWLWYPYRWGVGAKGIAKLLITKGR